jgi:arylformamidase
MPRFHDISWPIRTGGVIYPKNPPIEVVQVSDMSRGDSSNGSRLSFGSHTATHVDAPHHMINGAATVEQLPLDVLIGRALLVRFKDDVMSITADHLQSLPIEGHTRVLFATRNSKLSQQADFVPDYTYIAPDAAEYLVVKGIKLVGVDYLSIEQFKSGHHKTHKTLLGAGAVIVEGLQLSKPAAGVYELICLPLLIPGIDGAPARAVLRED